MKAIQRHLYWQLAAFVCLLGGFYAIYRNKVCTVHFRTDNKGQVLSCFYVNYICKFEPP